MFMRCLRDEDDIQLKIFTKRDQLILGLIVFLGAILRIAYQFHRPFAGDEIGTLLFMQKDPDYLLSHYGSWLTMNCFILLEKWIGSISHLNSWALTIPSLAASIAAIPLTALLARQLCNSRVALIAATLIAFNPYLLLYAPVIRAYSLLVAFALLSILALLAWSRKRTFKNGALFAATALVLLLLHLMSVYIMAFLGLLVVLDGVEHLRQGKPLAGWLKSTVSLLVPLAIVGLLVIAVYWRIYPGIKTMNTKWTGPAPTSVDYLPFVFRLYFTSGYEVLISIFFLALGLWDIIREKKPVLIFGLLLVIPICAMSWQGVAHYPWAFGRFLIFSLPILLIFMAEGVEKMLALLPGWLRTSSPWLALALSLLVIASWSPRVMRIFARKSDYPWLGVEQELSKLPKDTVIVAEDNDNLVLQALALKTGQPIQFLSDYVATAKDDGPVTLVYIDSISKIKTRTRHSHRRNIQILTYHADNKQQLLTQMYADLQASTKGQETEDLRTHYEALAALSMALGKPADETKSYLTEATVCGELEPQKIYDPHHLINHEDRP